MRNILLKTKEFKQNSPFAWFVISAVLIYVIWFGVIETTIQSFFMDSYTSLLAKVSHFVINWFDSTWYLEDNIIYFKPGHGSRVHESCTGLSFMGIFAAFTIAYPKKTKNKIQFLTLGLIGIWVINIFRIAFLSLIYKNFGASIFGIFHTYIFVFVIYTIILVSILWWIRKK